MYCPGLEIPTKKTSTGRISRCHKDDYFQLLMRVLWELTLSSGEKSKAFFFLCKILTNVLWDVKGNADVNLWIYVLYFVNHMYKLENSRGNFSSVEAQLRFITSKQSKQSKISTNLWNTTSSNEWIQHLIKGDRKFTFYTLGEILLFSAVSAWEWSNVVWQAILTRSQRLGDGQVLSEPCHFFFPCLLTQYDEWFSTPYAVFANTCMFTCGRYADNYFLIFFSISGNCHRFKKKTTTKLMDHTRLERTLLHLNEGRS